MTNKNPYAAAQTKKETPRIAKYTKSITSTKLAFLFFFLVIAYSHISFFSNVIIPQTLSNAHHHDHQPHKAPMEFFMELPSSTNTNNNEPKKAKLPKRRTIKEKQFRRNRNKNKPKQKEENKDVVTPIKESPKKTEVEKINLDECTYIHKNALDTTVYPACNIVHEISMTENNFSYLTEGTARATFLSKDATSTTIVFKISRWDETDFSPYGLSKNRKDGMTLEALTSSDYIVKIFGYCGASQILELGEGGNTHDLIQRSRDKKVNLSYLDRLKVSVQLATAVADLHDYAHASHRDICCHQFVNVNGVYKLNDFHLTKYTEHIPRTKKVCPLENANSYPKIHAPEEYIGVAIRDYNIDGQKADVYMLGNIMYNVLTNKWTYENVNRAEATKRLIHGITPDIPSAILAENKTDVSVNALLRGIQMCWTANVLHRPTARQVTNFLHNQLRKILRREQKPLQKVIQVDVPPLEKDYSYSDAGFYKYLYRKTNAKDIDHSEF